MMRFYFLITSLFLTLKQYYDIRIMLLASCLSVDVSKFRCRTYHKFWMVNIPLTVLKASAQRKLRSRILHPFAALTVAPIFIVDHKIFKK